MEGKKSRTPGQNCQAVSEVYGTLLLLIVTIILASSLVYPNIPKSAPIANILIEVHKDVPAGGDLPDTLSGSGNNTSSGSGTGPENNISSGSGSNISPADNYLLEASSGPGGSISPAGKTYVFGGSNVTFNMTPSANYKVLDVLVDGTSVGPIYKYTFNNVSSNHSIYVNFTVDFVVINNNTVVPKGNFTVNATVLGCAFDRGAGPSPVTCRFKLGNYNYDPWGDYTNPSKGNINDGKNYSLWESRISFNANTPVTVEACS
jgi:hypothetical protein